MPPGCPSWISDGRRLRRSASPCGVCRAWLSSQSLSVLDPQRQAPLVEALNDLVERLLPEVGDGEQILGGALHQFADGVHLRPLEAIAGPLGQVQVLDGQV